MAKFSRFATICVVGMTISAAIFADQIKMHSDSINKYRALEVSALENNEEGETPSTQEPIVVSTVDEATEEASSEQQSSVDFSVLPADCKAWMILNEMSFPVMQSDNNSFYLNRDWEGNKDKDGSIFLDHNTSLEDAYAIIYGHNMTSTKTMFNALFDVKVGDKMELAKPDGSASYTCVAKYETVLGDSAFMVGWDESNIQTLVDAICDAAGTNKVEVGQKHVVSLVTCNRQYAGKDGRLVCLFVED